MLHSAFTLTCSYVCRGFAYARALAETRCPVCFIPIVPDREAKANALCPACSAELTPYAGAHCPLCGLPHVDQLGPNIPCARCLITKPMWSDMAFYALYSGTLQSLLLRLKYQADFALIPVLGAMLRYSVTQLSPCDVLLSMPQHPSHLCARGYNQAHELAKFVARNAHPPHNAHGIPLKIGMLTRTRNPLPQTGLNAKQRWENPNRSFAAHGVKGLRILLVDDTMTTGATLHHATLALLEQGASSVAVAVVARTPPPSMECAGKAHDKQPFFV